MGSDHREEQHDTTKPLGMRHISDDSRTNAAGCDCPCWRVRLVAYADFDFPASCCPRAAGAARVVRGRRERRPGRCFTARVASGRDSALQLAPLLPYLGVDGAYVLARALGITALMFAALALSLGMAAGLSRAKQRPAPEWATRGHRQCGVLTLLLAVGHVALPYPSSFTPYGGWRTALLPFGQPFSWGVMATFAEISAPSRSG